MNDVDVPYEALGWRTYKWTTLISSMRWRARAAAQHIEAARASGNWSEEYLTELAGLARQIDDIARGAAEGLTHALRERGELRARIRARHPENEEFTVEEKQEILDHAANFGISRRFELCDEVRHRYEERVLREEDLPPWWPWVGDENL